MNKPKKLQVDFLTKFTLIKKFLVRAHCRARRTPNLILLWRFKYYQILAQEAENSTGARAEVRARQKIFRIQKVYEILYLLHTLDVFIA